MMKVYTRRQLMMEMGRPYDAEIEYLESTGTQYIDTNFIPDANSAAHIIWSPTGRTNDGYFGSRSTEFDGKYRFCGTTFESGAKFAFAMTYFEWPAGRIVLNINSIYDCYAENGKYIINGTEYSSNKVNDFQGSSFNVFNYKSSIQWVLSKMRCYALKLYSDGNIVRDMIPVRVGTTGYLYDKVSMKLFGNAGTGSFVLGPDK